MQLISLWALRSYMIGFLPRRQEYRHAKIKYRLNMGMAIVFLEIPSCLEKYRHAFFSMGNFRKISSACLFKKIPSLLVSPSVSIPPRIKYREVEKIPSANKLSKIAVTRNTVMPFCAPLRRKKYIRTYFLGKRM